MAEPGGRGGPAQSPAETAQVRVEHLRIRMPAGQDPTALARALAERLAASLPESGRTGDLGGVRTRVRSAAGHLAADELAAAVLAAVAGRDPASGGGEG